LWLGDFSGGGRQIGAIVQEIIVEVKSEAEGVRRFQQQFFTPQSGVGDISRAFSN